MEFPSQNYIGILQSTCQKARLNLPEYIDESTDYGFKFICKLGTKQTEGTGTSKKVAKQNVAKAMLTLIENEPFGGITQTNDPIKKKCVSMLMEYCTKEKKDFPKFNELDKHDELFCMECTFESFPATGKGHSKREAKENAARVIVEHFKIHDYFNESEQPKKNTPLTKRNPIADLINYCQRTERAVPSFEENIIKDRNVTKYKIICHLAKIKRESEYASSKKYAKLEASRLMLLHLQQCDKKSPTKTDNSCDSDEDVEYQPLNKIPKEDP